MDKRVFWIWLQGALGCGWPHTGRLLRDFGDAERVWQAEEPALRAAGLTGAALKRTANKALDKAEKQLRSVLAKGWLVLTPDMAAFPAAWAALPDLPLVIYATDELPADFDSRLVLSVIATRHISPEGLTRTGKMAAGLAHAGVVIVGDTIAGGDAAVMAAVSAVGGCGVLLQPCGLDVSYPQKTALIRDGVLKAGGVMLSEFPAGTAVRRENFHIRNRLLATLSDAIVVTEAGENSGTLRVAGMAAEAGHTVLAVPGEQACHAGCHRLIRAGAVLVQNAGEVAREFADRYPWLDPETVSEAERRYETREPEKPKKQKEKKTASSPRVKLPQLVRVTEPVAEPAPLTELPAGISANARTVAERLTVAPLGLEELAEQIPLSLPQVMMALTELELTGVAKSHAGGRYSWKG